MKKPSIIAYGQDILGLTFSPHQQTILKAFYAEPPTPEELAIYQKQTGRSRWPEQPFHKLTLIAGRRSGKSSRIGQVIVLYELEYGDHMEAKLGKDAPLEGEGVICALVAQDLDGSKTPFNYIRGRLRASPFLSEMEVDKVGQELRFPNGMTVKCFPSKPSDLRGTAFPVAWLDEVAWWRTEGSATSDVEIETAILGGTAGYDYKLVKTTSPYLRLGIAYEDYAHYFGADDSTTLVWVDSTAGMQPNLIPWLEEQRDVLSPEMYEREFGEGVWVDRVNAFLTRPLVEAVVMNGVHELPPDPKLVRAGVYVAAADPALGGEDLFVVAVSHAGPDSKRVVDLLLTWGGADLDIELVAKQAASRLKPYGVRFITGDKVGGTAVRLPFAKAGLVYLRTKGLTTSQAYAAAGPMIRRGQVALPDDRDLVREFSMLEVKNHPGRREPEITHPPGRHDDRAAACALAVVLADQRRQRREIEDDDSEEAEERRRPVSLADRRAQKKLEAVTAEYLELGGDPAPLDGWMERVDADDTGEELDTLICHLEDWIVQKKASLGQDTLRARLNRGMGNDYSDDDFRGQQW